MHFIINMVIFEMTLMYGVLLWVLYVKSINASNRSLLVLNHTYCCLCLIVIIFFSSALFCTYVSMAILSRIFQNNVEHYITNCRYGKISKFFGIQDSKRLIKLTWYEFKIKWRHFIGERLLIFYLFQDVSSQTKSEIK